MQSVHRSRSESAQYDRQAKQYLDLEGSRRDLRGIVMLTWMHRDGVEANSGDPDQMPHLALLDWFQSPVTKYFSHNPV